MSVSGWCSGPNGCDSKRAHGTCEDRIKRGLLDHCDCTRDDGHPQKESAD